MGIGVKVFMELVVDGTAHFINMCDLEKSAGYVILIDRHPRIKHGAFDLNSVPVSWGAVQIHSPELCADDDAIEKFMARTNVWGCHELAALEAVANGLRANIRPHRDFWDFNFIAWVEMAKARAQFLRDGETLRFWTVLE